MFDVDGTLVKSYEFDEECFVTAVSEVLGHDIDSNWDSYEHVSDAGILNEHLKRQGITSDHENIHSAVKKSFISKVQEYLSENPATEIPGASELIKKLKEHKDIEEFYLSDVDLYGIQTALDEEGIAKMVLYILEEVMV